MPPRRRKTKRPAAAVKQRFPANYFVKAIGEVTLASKADGSDTNITILDNSVDLSGATVHWNKLVIRFHFELEDSDVFIVGLTRQPQGSSPGALDDADNIRDLRSQNSWLRGPWIVGGVLPTGGVMGKAIVLKGLTLDDNDDVNLGLTAIGATAAGGQGIKLLVTGFYRKVS